MKPVSLPIAITILMMSCTEILSQKLVKDGHQWNVTYQPFDSPGTFTVLTKISGDTLVDDLLYSKIYHSQDTFGTNWTISNQFIREDEERKVFVKSGNLEEYLLYDFGLEVGATYMLECSSTVASIDSIILNNGESRKRLHLNLTGENYGPVWIEGIGEALGGLFGTSAYCISDVGGALRCFYDNDELLYPETPSTCFTETSNYVYSTLPSDIKIYPNPIYETVHITSESTKIKSLRIIDLIGRPVYCDVHKGDLIDGSDLTAGTYFIVLETENGDLYSEKLMKLE